MTGLPPSRRGLSVVFQSCPLFPHLNVAENIVFGLAMFGAPESGVDWSIINAGTPISVAPLLVAFLLFQRQFVQSFMYAGLK